MAWMRVGSQRDRLINLDEYVHIELIACDKPNCDHWAVEGIKCGSPERLFEGDRASCQSILEEVAEAVWAIEVGAETRHDPGTPDSCR